MSASRNEATPHVKLVTSVLFSESEPERPILEELERGFGKTELVSERFPFEHTRYYEEEMGPNLRRRMLVFRDTVPADVLVSVKHFARAVEDRFRDSRGRRKCNVDPGILGMHHFVLATHKGSAHRIYLGGGVYADLTLIYRHGSYRPLDWTYPDYASEPLIGFLNLVRRVYLWQRRRSRERH